MPLLLSGLHHSLTCPFEPPTGVCKDALLLPWCGQTFPRAAASSPARCDGWHGFSPRRNRTSSTGTTQQQMGTDEQRYAPPRPLIGIDLLCASFQNSRTEADVRSKRRFRSLPRLPFFSLVRVCIGGRGKCVKWPEEQIRPAVAQGCVNADLDRTQTRVEQKRNVYRARLSSRSRETRQSGLFTARQLAR